MGLDSGPVFHGPTPTHVLTFFLQAFKTSTWKSVPIPIFSSIAFSQKTLSISSKHGQQPAAPVKTRRSTKEKVILCDKNLLLSTSGKSQDFHGNGGMMVALKWRVSFSQHEKQEEWRGGRSATAGSFGRCDSWQQRSSWRQLSPGVGKGPADQDQEGHGAVAAAAGSSRHQRRQGQRGCKENLQVLVNPGMCRSNSNSKIKWQITWLFCAACSQDWRRDHSSCQRVHLARRAAGPAASRAILSTSGVRMGHLESRRPTCGKNNILFLFYSIVSHFQPDFLHLCNSSCWP